jgi:hypothetical protein
LVASLRVLAGKEARRRIESEGFTLDLFDTLIGASGGPKWLTLYGLDQVLAPALGKRDQPIDLVGSSIGAMRLACYAQCDPGAAFKRFLDAYTRTRDFEFVNETIAEFMMDTACAVAGQDYSGEILSNAVSRLHIVTTRCTGIADLKRAPVLSMIAPAVANVFGNSWMGLAGVERVLFSADLNTDLARNERYPGHRAELTPTNIIDTLLASGSIPGFVDSVRDIDGAPKGNYRDGGIVDYHFEPSWQAVSGLILYPHFSKHIVPGCFDKPFKHRHRNPTEWDRLVVLAPSDEYISRLPNGVIPDRRNVRGLSPEEIHHYWTRTAQAGHELGDCLEHMLTSGVVHFD